MGLGGGGEMWLYATSHGTGRSEVQNRLMFVEVLFRRGRANERCLALSNCYYGQYNGARTMEDEEFIDRARAEGMEFGGLRSFGVEGKRTRRTIWSIGVWSPPKPFWSPPKFGVWSSCPSLKITY